jgi:hypothetical protein
MTALIEPGELLRVDGEVAAAAVSTNPIEDAYYIGEMLDNWARSHPVPLLHCVRLVRCIVGNPFRPLAIEPVWPTPRARDLALAAYEQRRPDDQGAALDPFRLKLLADALIDAGCDDPAILGHLRDPGPHVAGGQLPPSFLALVGPLPMKAWFWLGHRIFLSALAGSESDPF